MSARGKKGRRQLVRDATALLRTAERNRASDEARHDHTLQRRFECAFESRDLVGSRAAFADLSDGGRAAWATWRDLDAEKRRIRRETAIRRAAASVPTRQIWLKGLLWAIYRNGSNRKKTMVELGLAERTYWWGLKFFSERYVTQ